MIQAYLAGVYTIIILDGVTTAVLGLVAQAFT